MFVEFLTGGGKSFQHLVAKYLKLPLNAIDLCFGIIRGFMFDLLNPARRGTYQNIRAIEEGCHMRVPRDVEAVSRARILNPLDNILRFLQQTRPIYHNTIV